MPMLLTYRTESTLEVIGSQLLPAGCPISSFLPMLCRALVMRHGIGTAIRSPSGFERLPVDLALHSPLRDEHHDSGEKDQQRDGER